MISNEANGGSLPPALFSLAAPRRFLKPANRTPHASSATAPTTTPMTMLVELEAAVAVGAVEAENFRDCVVGVILDESAWLEEEEDTIVVASSPAA